MELVKIENNQAVVSSRSIAEHCQLPTAYALRALRRGFAVRSCKGDNESQDSPSIRLHRRVADSTRFASKIYSEAVIFSKCGDSFPLTHIVPRS